VVWSLHAGKAALLNAKLLDMGYADSKTARPETSSQGYGQMGIC